MNLSKNIVAQSNELITASYSMTRNEQNVLLACISQIDSRSTIEDNKTFVITVEQAQDLFYTDKDKSHAYRDLQMASERLFERKVRISLDKGRELLTRFVQSVIFDENSGAVTIKFADDIKPYLSQLERNFTQYRISNIVQLTSIHAVKMFELITMWTGQSQYKKEIDLDEFRHLMGVAGKYKQFGQLKDRVINPAIEQINENTDFHVTVAFRKVRRSYQSIQLKYHKKEQPKTVAEPTKPKIKQSWKTKGLSDSQINKIKIYVRDFVDANTSKISTNDSRDYLPIFEDWIPLLKDPAIVNTFQMVQEILDRQRI